MASGKVLVFPTKNKTSSSDPMIELDHLIRGLWAGTQLFASLNLYAFEIFGLELMLWSAVCRTYTDIIFSWREETTRRRNGLSN